MSSYLSSLPSETAEGAPKYGGLASGVLVFSNHASTNEDRILLLQRAPHDSMPNLWEVAGGAVDPEDSTILHGAARELWEEAGLVVTSFRRQVGQGLGFTTRTKGLWMLKLVFEAEVESSGGVEVTLDEHEHQKFVWATEEECRAKKVVEKEGVVELAFTTAAQEETIFEGFRLRKQERGEL